MRSGIEDFKNSEHVTNALRAFDDGQFSDPLFHFCFEKCGDELDLLALLNNWYCVTTPIGTLRDNINYAQRCYEGGDKSDPTFRKLFGTWSRAAIEGGRTLFANAVPGVWINDSAIGALDSPIYVHGFRTIWLPIIDKIRPPKIYLCGGWAKEIGKILRSELPTQRSRRLKSSVIPSLGEGRKLGSGRRSQQSPREVSRYGVLGEWRSLIMTSQGLKFRTRYSLGRFKRELNTPQSIVLTVPGCASSRAAAIL